MNCFDNFVYWCPAMDTVGKVLVDCSIGEFTDTLARTHMCTTHYTHVLQTHTHTHTHTHHTHYTHTHTHTHTTNTHYLRTSLNFYLLKWL